MWKIYMAIPTESATDVPAVANNALHFPDTCDVTNNTFSLWKFCELRAVLECCLCNMARLSVLLFHVLLFFVILLAMVKYHSAYFCSWLIVLYLIVDQLVSRWPKNQASGFVVQRFFITHF
jgi:hypothetical protein